MYGYIGINEQTGNLLYKEVLDKKEQYLFTNLCQLVTNDKTNCVFYDSIINLGAILGEKNGGRFNQFLNHCENLNIVKKSYINYAKCLCINPNYYKRTKNVNKDIVSLFDEFQTT